MTRVRTYQGGRSMTRQMLVVAGLMRAGRDRSRRARRCPVLQGQDDHHDRQLSRPAARPIIEGRIVALHLPDHIPGNPTIVVKNVGGAGGIIGSNQLGEAAPNGETIGFFTLGSCPAS